jgi:hypothetical protein
MEQVIFWTVALGSGIFGIGLISAISARRQHKQERRTDVIVIDREKTISPPRDDSTGVMNMEASGTRHRWAASGVERPLAGAEQGAAQGRGN